MHNINTERSSTTPLEGSGMFCCFRLSEGLFLEMRQGLDWNDGMMLVSLVVLILVPQIFIPNSIHPLKQKKTSMCFVKEKIYQISSDV